MLLLSPLLLFIFFIKQSIEYWWVIIFIIPCILNNKSIKIEVYSFVYVLLITFLGFYTTCLLKLYLNPILAGSLVTFVFSVLPISKKHNSGIFYMGAFAAMSGFASIYNVQIIFIPIVASFFYYLVQNHFNGIGGKLGSIAFFGAITYYFIF